MNGIRSSPAASIVASRARRMLGRRAGVHRLHQALGHRLEHQAHRRVHLAQPLEVRAVEHAEVRVRQQPALERPLAGPDHVGGEVLVAVLAPAAARPRRSTSGISPVSTSSSLQPRRAASSSMRSTSSGACRCGAVRRERAVLAVAAARARQRQRVVAREGDASHGPQQSRWPALRSARPRRQEGRLGARPFECYVRARLLGRVDVLAQALRARLGSRRAHGRALDEQVPVAERRQHAADDRADDADPERRPTRRPPAPGRTSAPGSAPRRSAGR